MTTPEKKQTNLRRRSSVSEEGETRRESQQKRISFQDDVIKKEESEQKNTKTEVDLDEDVRFLNLYLLQFIIYLIWLSTTVVLVQASRSPFMYFFNDFINYHFRLRDTYVSHGSMISFDDMNSKPTYWNYITNTYLRAIHEDTNYNLENPANKRYLLEESLMIGPPFIVQKRITEKNCEVYNHVRKYYNACFPQYSKKIEIKEGNYKGAPYLDFDSNYNFDLHVYTDGGFVVPLTYDYNENKAIIESLSGAQDWIDKRTRLVTFELNLFNEKAMLISSSKVVGEFTAMGAVKAELKTSVCKYHNLWGPNNYIVRTSIIIFFCCLAYFTIEKFYKMYTKRCPRFLYSIRNMVESLNLLVIYLCIGYQFWHVQEVNRIMKVNQDNPMQFQNIDRLIYFNQIYLSMASVSILLTVIRIFKYFTFSLSFIQFGQTLIRCFRDLLGFTAIFAIVFLTYAFTGFLLFGTQHMEFNGIEASFFTTMRLMLGGFNFTKLEEYHPVIAPLYCCSFVLIMTFLFINMFLTIISDTYVIVSEDFMSGRVKKHATLGAICKYYFKKLKKLCSLCKKKGKHSKPKPVEVVNQNAVSKLDILENYFERISPVELVDTFDPKPAFKRLDDRITTLKILLDNMNKHTEQMVERSHKRKYESDGTGVKTDKEGENKEQIN